MRDLAMEWDGASPAASLRIDEMRFTGDPREVEEAHKILLSLTEECEELRGLLARLLLEARAVGDRMKRTRERTT